MSGGLGVWWYVCDNSAFSSLPGRKSSGSPLAVGRWRHGPQTTISQNPGREGGGGLGGVAYKDRARPPPPGGVLSTPPV